MDLYKKTAITPFLVLANISFLPMNAIDWPPESPDSWYHLS